MKKSIFIIVAMVAIFSSSCKKDETTNNTTAAVTGTWNLQLWDGEPANGTLVFRVHSKSPNTRKSVIF